MSTMPAADPHSPVPPRILLAKLGLDGHDRGVKVIARALRDAGMEVVYLGMRVTADQVAAAAVQEDVDVVGISILSGAHLRLMPRLVAALERHGIAGDSIISAGGSGSAGDSDRGSNSDGIAGNRSGDSGSAGTDGAGGRRDGVLLLVGGTIPDGDVPALQEMGVDGVFPVGSFTGQMVEFIRTALAER